MRDMSSERNFHGERSLLSTLANSGAWRLFCILFVYLSGLLLLLPILPIMVTNDFATRHNGGKELHCEDFPPGNEPKPCQDAHASVVWASTLSGFAQNTIFSVILTPALGSWSDVNGRKPFLLLSMFLAIIPLIIVVLNISIGLPLYFYYMVTAFSGSVTCIAPALSYLADVVPPRHRAASFGLIMASFSTAVLVGPPLGATIPPHICPLVAILTIVCCMIMVVFVLPESLDPQIAARAGSSQKAVFGMQDLVPSPNNEQSCIPIPIARTNEEACPESIEKQKHSIAGSSASNYPLYANKTQDGSMEEKQALLNESGASSLELNKANEIEEHRNVQNSSENLPIYLDESTLYKGNQESSKFPATILSSAWKSLAILRRNALFIRLTIILMMTAIVSEGLQDLLIQYLQIKLGFRPKDNSQLFIILGMSSLIVQGVLLRPLLTLFGEARLLCFGITLSSMQQLALALAHKNIHVFWAIGVGSFVSVTFPTISSIKANNAEEHEQGTVQGALAGARALASGIGPLIFAALFAAFTKAESPLPYFPGAPFVLGSILMAVTATVTAQLPADAGGNSGRWFEK